MSLSLCAYCGELAVRGDEEVEHPIPAAAGSLAFKIRATCEDCQAYTSTEVDEPFLRDDFSLMMRGESRIADRRHGNRIPKSPLRRGTSEHGADIVMDDDGTPRMVKGSWSVDADRNLHIVADSTDAYRHWARQVAHFFASHGHEPPDLGEPEWVTVKPSITGKLRHEIGRWRRAAAKVALGAGALGYEDSWRRSPDAGRLQRLMRGEEVDGIIVRATTGDVLVVIAAGRPPRHRVFFHPLPSGRTGLTVMFFGTNPVTLIVDTDGRPFPALAWDIDPLRPSASGRTAWSELLKSSLIDLQGSAEDLETQNPSDVSK